MVLAEGVMGVRLAVSQGETGIFCLIGIPCISIGARRQQQSADTSFGLSGTGQDGHQDTVAPLFDWTARFDWHRRSNKKHIR